MKSIELVFIGIHRWGQAAAQLAHAIWAERSLPAIDTLDVISLAALIVVILASTRLGMYLFALLTLPGTAAHEACHYLTAFAFDANPHLPTLIPKKRGNYWVMGSVAFTPSLINRIPVAMAPTILLPLGLLYADMVMHSASGWHYVGHAYLAASCLTSAMPSRQDFIIAVPAAIIAALVGIGIHILHRA